jgi:hypothetical protein
MATGNDGTVGTDGSDNVHELLGTSYSMHVSNIVSLYNPPHTYIPLPLSTNVMPYQPRQSSMGASELTLFVPVLYFTNDGLSVILITI